MYASMRLDALAARGAQPAGRAWMRRAPGAARPVLLHVAHPGARGPAVNAAQPGGGGGGGSTPLKPPGTGGSGDGDGDDSARAPGPYSWAGPLAPAVPLVVGAFSFASLMFTVFATYDKVTHSLARTEDLAKLRDLVEASRQEAQAGQQELRALMLGLEGRLEGRLGQLEGRLDGRLGRLEGRLEAVTAVLGTGAVLGAVLLVVWAGRKPGAARRAPLRRRCCRFARSIYTKLCACRSVCAKELCARAPVATRPPFVHLPPVPACPFACKRRRAPKNGRAPPQPPRAVALAAGAARWLG
ncbi:MAG: hypothetical protein J3K34DRAFT_524103 [Monoraphidium minutum]|nr:MAG: hypothetical protein J3K34DRAFT_524103 [Monoraphidium minutum]